VRRRDVDRERPRPRGGIALDVVDAVAGGRIDHPRRPVRGEHPVDRGRVGDVEVAALEGHQGGGRQRGPEVAPELAPGPDQEDGPGGQGYGGPGAPGTSNTEPPTPAMRRVSSSNCIQRML